MIGFTHKFVKALSNEEIEFLANCLYAERESRLLSKVKEIGSSVELCAQEKVMVNNGALLNAIRHYRARNGCSLVEAKNRVEEYRNSL